MKKSMKDKLAKQKKDFDAFEKSKGKTTKADGNSNLFKVEIGETKNYALVEYKDGDLWKEYHVLWNFRKDGKPVLCPKANNGSQSAIQDFSQVLWNSDEKEFQDVAKKMWPKLSCVFQGLERGREQEGLIPWAQTDAQFKQTMKEILKDENVEDGGCIHDGKEKAIDLQVEATQGPKYKKVEISAARKPSPLFPANSGLKLEELQENEPNPDDLYATVTYEETKELLKKFLKENDIDPDAMSTEEPQDEGGTSESISDKFNKMKERLERPDDDDIPF